MPLSTVLTRVKGRLAATINSSVIINQGGARCHYQQFCLIDPRRRPDATINSSILLIQGGGGWMPLSTFLLNIDQERAWRPLSTVGH